MEMGYIRCYVKINFIFVGGSMDKNKNRRFEILSEEKLNCILKIYIVRDKHTGILYACSNFDRGGGMTPLLDKDGNPIQE